MLERIKFAVTNTKTRLNLPSRGEAEYGKTVDQRVVRVVPLQIRWANTSKEPFMELIPESIGDYRVEIESILYDVNNPLHYKYTEGRRFPLSEEEKADVSASILLDHFMPAGDICMTHSVWILKNKDSTNPNQLMLPGGKIREGETDQDAGKRELEEEIHAYGIGNNLRMLTGRRYSFDNTKRGYRINNTERILHGQIPHSIKTRNYNPVDHAQGVFELTPNQVDELFINQRLKNPNGTSYMELLDSLNPYKTSNPYRVETDGKEDHVRQKILDSVWGFETQTRIKVIDNMLLLTSHSSRDEFMSRWYEIKSKYQARSHTQQRLEEFNQEYRQFLQDFENSYDTDQAIYRTPNNNSDSRLSQSVVNTHRYKKRLKLRHEIARAIDQVILVETSPFLNIVEPQKPFILAQALLKRGLDITNHEFTLIAKQSPDVALVYESACKMFSHDQFEIDPKNDPDWYENLITLLDHFAKLRIRVVKNQASSDEIKYFERSRSQLRSHFAQKLGINEEEIVDLAKGARNFMRSLVPPLLAIAGKDTIDRLFPNPHYTGTASLTELILVAFGYDQYTGEKTVTSENQWAAWQKILLMQRVHKDQREHNKQLNMHTEPFRQVFSDIAEFIPELPEQKQGLEDLAKYKLKEGIVIPGGIDLEVTQPLNPELGKIHIDFSELPQPQFYTYSRDKEEESLTRKTLERGFDVVDFFGQLFVLDEEAFIQSLIQTTRNKIIQNNRSLGIPSFFDEQINNAVKVWSKQVITTIIKKYYESLSQWGYNFGVKKIKEDKEYEGTTEQSGVPIIDKDHKGSGASELEWSQVKFVHEIRRPDDIKYLRQQEIQFYPTIKDLMKKRADDPEFWVRRLFVSHNGNYPLLLVLFGIQESYEELMQETTEGNNNRLTRISQPIYAVS